jgi:hypothetical protein
MALIAAVPLEKAFAVGGVCAFWVGGFRLREHGDSENHERQEEVFHSGYPYNAAGSTRLGYDIQ